MDIGRYNHPAPRHLGSDELGRELLAVRDEGHLLRDDALPGEVHLALVRARGALRESDGHHLCQARNYERGVLDPNADRQRVGH